jgi:hypothetical protein
MFSGYLLTVTQSVTRLGQYREPTDNIDIAQLQFPRFVVEGKCEYLWL